MSDHPTLPDPDPELTPIDAHLEQPKDFHAHDHIDVVCDIKGCRGRRVFRFTVDGDDGTAWFRHERFYDGVGPEITGPQLVTCAEYLWREWGIDVLFRVQGQLLSTADALFDEAEAAAADDADPLDDLLADLEDA